MLYFPLKLLTIYFLEKSYKGGETISRQRRNKNVLDISIKRHFFSL